MPVWQQISTQVVQMDLLQIPHWHNCKFGHSGCAQHLHLQLFWCYLIYHACMTTHMYTQVVPSTQLAVYLSLLRYHAVWPQTWASRHSSVPTCGSTHVPVTPHACVTTHMGTQAVPNTVDPAVCSTSTIYQIIHNMCNFSTNCPGLWGWLPVQEVATSIAPVNNNNIVLPLKSNKKETKVTNWPKWD